MALPKQKQLTGGAKTQKEQFEAEQGAACDAASLMVIDGTLCIGKGPNSLIQHWAANYKHLYDKWDSFYRAVKRRVEAVAADRQAPKSGRGPNRRLPKDMEQAICDWVRACAMSNLHVPTELFKVKAMEVAQACDRPFTAAGGLPSKEWVQDFFRRYDLRHKCVRPLSTSRMMAAWPPNLVHWGTQLAQVLDTVCDTATGETYAQRVDRMGNWDEAGMQAEMSAPTGVVPADAPAETTHRPGAQSKQSCTIILGGSPNNYWSPSFFIFSGSTHTDDHMQHAGEADASAYMKAENHVMDHVVFGAMLRRLAQVLPGGVSPDKRYLLLLDGHGSRIMPESILTAKKLGFDVFLYPPNATHFMQVMDRIFGPFKALYRRYYSLLLALVGTAIDQHMADKAVWVKLMCDAKRALICRNPELMQAMWSKCGIIPLNVERIILNGAHPHLAAASQHQLQAHGRTLTSEEVAQELVAAARAAAAQAAAAEDAPDIAHDACVRKLASLMGKEVRPQDLRCTPAGTEAEAAADDDEPAADGDEPAAAEDDPAAAAIAADEPADPVQAELEAAVATLLQLQTADASAADQGPATAAGTAADAPALAERGAELLRQRQKVLKILSVENQVEEMKVFLREKAAGRQAGTGKRHRVKTQYFLTSPMWVAQAQQELAARAAKETAKGAKKQAKDTAAAAAKDKAAAPKAKARNAKAGPAGAGPGRVAAAAAARKGKGTGKAAGAGKQRAEDSEDEASDSEAEPSASDEEQDAAPSPAPMQTAKPARRGARGARQAALTATAGSPKRKVQGPKPARTARAAMGTPGKQQPRKSNRAPAARKLDEDYDYSGGSQGESS